jgi:hypothetical protein
MAGATTTSSGPSNSTTACRPCSTISTWRIPVDLANVPRFNESEGHGPKRAHPVEAYFDDLSMHLVYEMYKPDFELFRYDFEDPSNKMPVGEIDLDEVHAKLGD